MPPQNYSRLPQDESSEVPLSSLSMRGQDLLAHTIRNEAFKNDPPDIYGWRVYALACSACLGGMVQGVDIGIIGGVLALKPFQEAYGLAHLDKIPLANLQGNIVTTLLCGGFAGALVAGPLADRVGRRLALIIAASLALLGGLMQAVASGELSAFYVGRFLAGSGVGVTSVVTPLFVSEHAPRAIRGGLTGIYQLFIVIGTMLAFWINYGAYLHLNGNAQYLVPLSLQCLPAVLLFLTQLMCFETPRWLGQKDRWSEALSVLARVRNLPPEHEYIQEEIGIISDQWKHEQDLASGSGLKSLAKEMFLVPSNRNRALISVGLMICQQMTGGTVINYYAPQIFKNVGLTDNAAKLFATGIYGVVKVVMCACFITLGVDSVGRRKSLLWTSIAMAASIMYVGLYIRISPPVEGQAIPPAGYVALVCIYLFASFFQWGWGPVCWIYVSEIPSARLRGLNVGLAAATAWLFSIVITRAVPSMLATMGRAGYGTFVTFSCFCLTMFVFTWFCVPETKGIRLEHMGELFGEAGSSHLAPADSSSLEAGSVGQLAQGSIPLKDTI